ncbi:hypothetical protein N7462_010077 [Penicillium macrosclerotiorum]|uniref:uncharacterized protein n=1 Tax=Penicillium macrosclerotiorum TaxID=303699 RepID=UPI0025472746|nr:uncharacterized protein N7462_010077 [Penicillium macrosclerotiorum]KAJ5669007.1 hypothetical protein N7462_010077 [Penicillium macrosclerotiorum]
MDRGDADTVGKDLGPGRQTLIEAPLEAPKSSTAVNFPNSPIVGPSGSTGLFVPPFRAIGAGAQWDHPPLPLPATTQRPGNLRA